MSDGGINAGDAGGIFAGAVAVLAVLGKGIKWAAGWSERRAGSRHAKLDAWQAELASREARIDAQVEARLVQLERQRDVSEKQIAALWLGFTEVAAALRTSDPANPVLARAERALASVFDVFPLDPTLPTDMARIVGDVDRKDRAATAAARTGATS